MKWHWRKTRLLFSFILLVMPAYFVCNARADTPNFAWRIFTHPGSVFAVAISPDSRTIATGGEDSKVRLWDVETGKVEGEFTTTYKRAWLVTFSPDGELLAAICTRGNFQELTVWQRVSGVVQWTKPYNSLAYSSTLAFSPNSKVLANFDGKITLWDAKSGTLLRQLAMPERSPGIFAFSRDGHTIGNYVGRTTMQLWDARSGQLIREFDFGVKPFFERVFSNFAFSARGNSFSTIVLKNTKGVMRYRTEVRDFITGKLLRADEFGTKEIRTVAISETGRRLLVHGADNSLIVIPVPDGTTSSPLPIDDRIYSPAFSPDDKTFVYINQDGEAKLIAMENKARL